jgi:hypothetical protein
MFKRNRAFRRNGKDLRTRGDEKAAAHRSPKDEDEYVEYDDEDEDVAERPE